MTTTTNPYTLGAQAALAALEAGRVIEYMLTIPWMPIPCRFVKRGDVYLRGYPETPRSMWREDYMFPLGVMWRVVPEEVQLADDRVPLQEALATVNRIAALYHSRKPDMP